MGNETWYLVPACIIEAIIAFLIGVRAGHHSTSDIQRSMLNSVGIDRIAECSIDTPNCHSNWYEIVWIDENKKETK